MRYTFHAKGHKNILATHKNTLEFTKEAELSLDGDCIVGVEADFDTVQLQKLAKSHRHLLITITAGKNSDTLDFYANKEFTSTKELVVRFSEFSSNRTFGYRATKSARHLDKDLVKKMQDPQQQITIVIEPFVKAFLFDFDDTLEEFRNAKILTHQKLAKRMLDEHGVYEPTTITLLNDIDQEFSLKGVHSAPSNYDRHNWFREYFNRIGVETTDKEVYNCVTLYWRFIIEAAKPMPGAAEVLGKIKQDYKIAIITDSDGDRRLKTERAKTVGIIGFADLFITSDDTGINKPDNKFYSLVFDKFGVKAEECVMVGDKPQVDLELAKSLGMKTVWMKHGDWARMQGESHFEYVDYEITELSQLLEIIKGI
jgi:HAD superfamily hydrolase (TIGR01509 family)